MFGGLLIRGLGTALVILSIMGSPGSCEGANGSQGDVQMRVISVPSGSGKAIGFAASELSKYLEAMTYEHFRVEERESDGTELVKLAIDGRLKGDGYHVCKRNGRILIEGGSSRGCLYGAYALLRELGCRWPLPGKEYEVIPRIKEVEWSGDIKSEPAFSRRGMLIASNPEESLIAYVDFLAKNGFNFVFPYLTANLSDALRDRLASAMEEREMGLDYGGHWLPGLLPRDLLKDHPEYFRMEDGKRTNDLNMCASNSEAIGVMAGNARTQVDYMRTFSKPETLHLWADDIFGGGWCSCDACKELTGSDQLLQVLNRLGDQVDPGDTKLAFIAYHGSVYPPTRVKASEHTRLMYAGRERCYRHALDECEANRRYLGYLKGDLKAMPNGAEVFDYLQDCILLRFMAVPLHPTIGKDARIYKDLGVDGVFAHAFTTYSDWAYGPNAYVLGKALWRGEGSAQDIEEYCTAVYGPAGGAMREYFDMLFELGATVMATCGYKDFADMRYPPIEPFNKKQVEQITPLISEAHLSKIESKLRQALNVGREPYHSRVEDQMLLWRYTRGEALAVYHTLQANVREAEIEHAKAVMSSEEMARARDEMVRRYAQIVEELESGTDMLVTAPERLRGHWGGKESGAIAERGQFGYVAAMRERLDSWKKRG